MTVVYSQQEIEIAEKKAQSAGLLEAWSLISGALKDNQAEIQRLESTLERIRVLFPKLEQLAGDLSAEECDAIEAADDRARLRLSKWVFARGWPRTTQQLAVSVANLIRITRLDGSVPQKDKYYIYTEREAIAMEVLIKRNLI